jgi:hypothetical protein
MKLPKQPMVYVFIGLLAVLALVVYFNWGAGPTIAAVFSGSARYEPMKLRDPTLRVDLIEKAQALEYVATRRNIFSATPPPPPAPKEPPKSESALPTVAAVLDAPPPLVVPFKFYGLVTEQNTGHRRGCFTNGEDIFIVAEGGVIQARFRLVKLGNASADIEEIASGRRATIPLDVMAGPG